MESNNHTLSEEEYFNSLKIESEEDLLNEIEGFKSYDYITSSEINDIIEETDNLCRVTRFTIEELKWNIKNKRQETCRYLRVYELFIEHLEYYLEKLKVYHKSVYVSIYKIYEDKILNTYEKKLESLFDEFKNIEIHRNEDKIWNLVDIVFPKFDYSNINDEYEGKYQDFIANFFYNSFRSVIDNIFRKINEIEFVVKAIFHTRIYRTKKEEGIIYNYIKKSFDEAKLDDYLSKKKREYVRYLEDRRMMMNICFLRKQLNGLEQICNNYTLCKIWTDSEYSEDETEELAYKLSKEQATPEEFERLFKYQGERKMLRDEIARMDDLERNGDPMFAQWVDPFKLEDYLKPWIKAYITTQEKWYIVWCLMKYTFEMIREGIDKNDFAARMKEMFPKAEKKCVVESFRKKETQLDHNRHFSKWRDDDPDYLIAQSLYEKMKNKNAYCRIISF